MRWLCILLALVIGAALASQAHPAGLKDYEGWIETLKQPGTGVSCCSLSDGHLVDYRLTPGGYEVFYDKKWKGVPEGAVMRIINPTGRGVVFISPISGTVLCFVPSMES